MNSVRELQLDEIASVVDYFHEADTEYLIGMGVDRARLPDRGAWIASLRQQVEAGERFYVAWLVDERPVGHSNLSNIVSGDHANMHLHIWDAGHRRAGRGVAFLRQTLPIYFRRFELRKLVCEPYALNPAPRKALEAVGFELVKRYDTVPGRICFYQPVNRFELEADRVADLAVRG